MNTLKRCLAILLIISMACVFFTGCDKEKIKEIVSEKDVVKETVKDFTDTLYKSFDDVKDLPKNFENAKELCVPDSEAYNELQTQVDELGEDFGEALYNNEVCELVGEDVFSETITQFFNCLMDVDMKITKVKISGNKATVQADITRIDDKKIPNLMPEDDEIEELFISVLEDEYYMEPEDLSLFDEDEKNELMLELEKKVCIKSFEDFSTKLKSTEKITESREMKLKKVDGEWLVESYSDELSDISGGMFVFE